MARQRFYIETYGCQMNVSDSELMAGVLAGEGYVSATSAEDADIVLLNTCAIREKAEDRIFGRLGHLKSEKARRPEMIIGVAGCMAEHLREKLVERTPYVDLVIGPDAYRRLPELVRGALGGADPQIDVRLDRAELYDGVEVKRRRGVSGFVTVMRGCDKFCTFCVVPYVRGRERSVPPQEVVRQAVVMERQGFQEVTLLGQTVSSYDVDGCDFAGLLRAIHARTSMRIRFTSPYPTDFDEPLLETLRDLPRVGRHLHLPLQSGSTSVLAQMKRQYTAEQFRTLITSVRRIVPDFSLSTDIIVGFPGETEADFQQTLDLCREVRFDSAFMFMYSERDGTKASKSIPDDVPDAVKRERLQRLIALQHESSELRSKERVGQWVEVLVNGENRKDDQTMIGRSSCFRPTIVPKVIGDRNVEVGDWVRGRVVRATRQTLFTADNAFLGDGEKTTEPTPAVRGALAT